MSLITGDDVEIKMWSSEMREQMIFSIYSACSPDQYVIF